MTANSKIEWTDHTFNPWWGCVRVSPGCTHCYAETFAKRVGHKVWGVDAPRRFFGAKHWAEPLKWNRDAEATGVRARVFCASMADVFEDRRDLDAERAKLWALIESTPSLDWLLLTKRPEDIARLLPGSLPRGNVWLGTTCEDQQRADERIPHLLVNDAAVRFLSCEPLLGPVDLMMMHAGRRLPHLVDWVIVGGESGHGARSFGFRWAVPIVEACRAADVAVFVKQMGARPVDGADALVRLNDRTKGADMDEWPTGLRVREFPTPRVSA